MKAYCKEEVFIIFKGYTNAKPIGEIVNDLKAKGYNRDAASIYYKVRSLSISRPNGKVRYKKYTPEIEAYLRENAHLKTAAQLEFIINNRFNVSLTKEGIRAKCRRMGNPAKSHEYSTKHEYTPYRRVKPEYRKRAKREVGDVFKMNYSRGQKFWFIKTLNSDGKTKFVLLHHYNWKEQYGAIPKNHCITFKDGNPDNIKLGDCSNLECIPKIELANRNRWKSKRNPPVANIAKPKLSLTERILRGDSFV